MGTFCNKFIIRTWLFVWVSERIPGQFNAVRKVLAMLKIWCQKNKKKNCGRTSYFLHLLVMPQLHCQICSLRDLPIQCRLHSSDHFAGAHAPWRLASCVSMLWDVPNCFPSLIGRHQVGAHGPNFQSKLAELLEIRTSYQFQVGHKMPI